MEDVASIRASIAAKLGDAGAPSPFLEADRIICRVLGAPRSSLHAHPEREPSSGQRERIVSLAARRASGEPMAYILGDAIFCGMRFLVDERALIPRTETETLTELADELLKVSGGPFADWCTGSGCIAVTLLVCNESSSAYAVDVSDAALAVARRNAALHGVERRVTFLECASPSSDGPIPPASLGLVVTNPPYIPTATIETLETQVKDHEPRAALDGGRDGLNVYRTLFAGIPPLMKPGAPLIAETGGGAQIDELASCARALAPCLSLDKIFPDHRGIDRFMLWRKRV
ncbi:MAG: peptide chain release factor N(5)-glutamine methyltransferase [Synergistaceae bacterium]|jgi:release factor glutamine methyltransferase|nr:peptide chain release factor N(5)-glutamine methyltransferase [Synergistaceae bacterium]